jgi:hypothetical protein
MAEQGFLIDQKTATDIGRVFTKVFGPNGSPAGDRIYNDNSIEIKHVRLLAVQDPLPSESADMVGYTAEVLKIDYATGTLVSTGITFDPDGDVEDYDIVKNYVYNLNSSAKLDGQIVTVTFKYVDDEDVSGIWTFSEGGGGAQRPYLKIKTVIDRNNYTADVITPTSATVLKSGVTVKALQPDAGASMKVEVELFADIVDDVYYIQPAVFYGD